MLKLSFTGDVSLNGYYYEMAKNNENPFEYISNQFDDSDLVTINLEAVCSSPTNELHKKKTKLNIHPSTLSFLNTINTGLVTLANNHANDNLQSGFELTLKLLKEYGIEYTGAYLKDEIKDPFTIKKQGKSVIFLNYVHELTHPGIEISDGIHLNLYNKKQILADIKMYNESHDFIILLLHWGQDDSRYPAPWQRKDAKDFVNAGVNIIIGHHSHVLQGFEVINNSPIFYSLGNFAFSALRKGEKIDQKRHIESIVVNLLIKQDNVSFEIVPLKIFGHAPKTIQSKSIYKLSKRIKYFSNSFVWPFYLIYLNFLYKAYFYFLGNDRDPIQQLKKINKAKIKRVFHLLYNLKN